MPTVVFKNAYLSIGGVDLSTSVAEVALNISAEMLDESAMGDNTRMHKGGLKDWTISPKFHNDFSAANVDATLWSLVGTTSDVEVRAVNTCTTGINPRWYGVGVIESYAPLGGAVGALLDAPVSIRSADDLTRSTTAT